MHKPESTLNNERHKIIWNFEIQTDQPIPGRRPDQEIINERKKGTCCRVDFSIPVDHRVKIKESEEGERDKY